MFEYKAGYKIHPVSNHGNKVSKIYYNSKTKRLRPRDLYWMFIFTQPFIIVPTILIQWWAIYNYCE